MTTWVVPLDTVQAGPNDHASHLKVLAEHGEEANATFNQDSWVFARESWATRSDRPAAQWFQRTRTWPSTERRGGTNQGQLASQAMNSFGVMAMSSSTV